MPKKNEKTGGDKTTKCLDDLTAEGKEFYSAQVRDLEEQLDKYKHKCDELEVLQKDFSSHYETSEKEKKDIVSYLKRSLAQKEDEVSSLSDRLLSMQQAKDVEIDSFELQLSQLRQEFQDNKEKLTTENMNLAGKLAALEEFRVQKEELIAHLDALKEQLGKQKEEHHAVIYNLERKAVLDNDRLKKEMHKHVAAVAAEFRHVSDRKMPETTMRAIHENVSVTAQLSQLSDRSRQLLEDNEVLRKAEKQLRREMEVLEPLLNEMTRKSLSNQKVVYQLTEKCKQLQAELQGLTAAQVQHQQLQGHHDTLQAEINKLRHEHTLVLEECGKNRVEADRLATELQEESRLRGQLESVLEEAAFALKEALKDVPKEKDSEVETIMRRNQMMQKLLAVLDKAAQLGKGPALKDFLLEKTGPKHGPAVKVIHQQSHFKTGDLGLVPRPTLNYSSTLSKTGLLSKSTRLNLHRSK
ncbi:cilia- and flagella-associated protein 157 [Aplochiton taeniatus]